MLSDGQFLMFRCHISTEFLSEAHGPLGSLLLSRLVASCNGREQVGLPLPVLACTSKIFLDCARRAFLLFFVWDLRTFEQTKGKVQQVLRSENSPEAVRSPCKFAVVDGRTQRMKQLDCKCYC